MKQAIAWLLEHACSITGDVGGCWLLNNSPLRRVWWWSLGLNKETE